MRLACARLVLVVLLLLPGGARAADLLFTTSDGVRLHLIEEGQRGRKTIVFVPGWTMPAWIFKLQIDAFAARYHVIAMDPRGQGDSEIPAGGYDYIRRGQDVGDLVKSLASLPGGGPPVLLVGWSLGVLDVLSYVHQEGDARIAGLVLIDNSVGEDPPPPISRLPAKRGPRLAREEQMRRFVASMFRSAPGAAYLAQLTDTALRTPPEAAAQLGSYGVARTYWKEAVYSTKKPVLYVVRPGLAGQAGNLAARHPAAEATVFAQAGHALFIDEAARFNTLMDGFIRRRVWP